MTEPTRLTPFVDDLARTAKESLARVLGLGARLASLSLQPMSDAPGRWMVEATVRDEGGDFVVELFEKDNPREAWFRTERFAVSYRTSASSDPFARPASASLLHALRERMTRADAATPSGEVRAAAELLARHRPFLPIADGSYRMIFRGGARPTGLLWLGFGCNQNCGMCWQGRAWPEPPHHFYSQWLDEFVAAKVEGVVFSGGEPTLHPMLPALLARAKSAGVHAVVETNGVRLADAEVRRLLVDSGARELFVSLHAPDAVTSDALTRAPGSFEQTVAGIERCLDEGMSVGIHTVVVRENHGRLLEHAQFLVERFVAPMRGRAGARALVRVSFSLPTRFFDGELYRRSLVSVDDVRPQLGPAVRLLRAAGVEVAFLGMSGFPLCAYDRPRDELARVVERTPDGEMLEGRAFGDRCDSCAARAGCLGVPSAYVELHGGRGLDPIAR